MITYTPTLTYDTYDTNTNWTWNNQTTTPLTYTNHNTCANWSTHTITYGPYTLTTDYTGYYTSTTDTTGTTYWTQTPQLTPQQKLQQALQARHTPHIITTRKHTPHTQDPKETKARETLQLCLGETLYRKYLKHGFITAQAKSGKTYQIYPGHGITNVYKNGQMIERLCVILNGDYPPADSLIMRYLLILNDEQTFRSKAVHHAPHPRKCDQKPYAAPQRTHLPLPELYKLYKQNAA
jgi:hypothetical protein